MGRLPRSWLICWASAVTIPAQAGVRATLVDHAEGMPSASAVRSEHRWRAVNLTGRPATPDAGHAGQKIQRAISGQRGGRVLVLTKGNCPQTWATLTDLNRVARRGADPAGLAPAATAKRDPIPLGNPPRFPGPNV